MNNIHSPKEHWEKVYGAKPIEKLGWYESNPAPSLELINSLDVDFEDHIIDIGCGATTLIDKLLEAGYRNISAADISSEALEILYKRLGDGPGKHVRFIQDDISNSQKLYFLEEAALWHDRAVLHFLVEEKDRAAYLEVLKKLVKMGGFVIIAAFSKKGAKKCSGLEIRNYDEKMLSDFLGKDFKLLKQFDFEYIQPSGNPRPFIYTLFERIN